MNVIAAEKDTWIKKLAKGTLDISNPGGLEDVEFADLIEQLRSYFDYQFLNHSQRQKKEIGFAESFRRSLPRQARKGSQRRASPQEFHQHFHDCVLLTGEFGAVTGFAKMRDIHFRHDPKRPGSIKITSGEGINLFRDIDGWKIAFLEERTVTLTMESLQKRGWLYRGPNRIHPQREDR